MIPGALTSRFLPHQRAERMTSTRPALPIPTVPRVLTGPFTVGMSAADHVRSWSAATPF